MTGPIAIDAPVRLIQGQADPEVPWERALALAALIRSAEVQTWLVKDGDHRLSRERDIALILRAIEDVLSCSLRSSDDAIGPHPTAADEPAPVEMLDLATGDPKAGEAAAIAWRTEGGGYLSRQCLGVAYANQSRWPSAAGAFEEAAREAEAAHDTHSADYWAQAGNAWLAAGEAGKARSALDAALSSATLLGLALGETHLDRARARVALGDTEGARSDIDRALTFAAPIHSPGCSRRRWRGARTTDARAEGHCRSAQALARRRLGPARGGQCRRAERAGQ